MCVSQSVPGASAAAEPLPFDMIKEDGWGVTNLTVLYDLSVEYHQADCINVKGSRVLRVPDQEAKCMVLGWTSLD